MQSTGLIQQSTISEPLVTRTARRKRFVGNFVTASLATLAVYVFLVALPFWVFSLDTYYEFIDKIDPFAGVLVMMAGALIARRFEARQLSQTELEKYRYWMNAIIRYTLAYVFLLYGFAKIFGGQFYSLPVTLDTPLRDISGIQLTWRFFGYSYAYTLFVASSQIIGAVLLFFRRTTTLAALMTLPIISNIVFLNFTHNIPVRLYSCIYLILTLYVVLLDYRKLKAVFWDNRPFANRMQRPFVGSRRLQVVKSLIVAVLLIGAIADNYYSKLLVQKLKSPLHGVWEVKEYRVNDLPLEYDAQRSVWRKVYFEFADLAAIRTDEAKPRYVIPTIDTEQKTIRLADRNSEEVVVEGVYEQPSAEELILQVSNGRDSLRVTLHKLP